MDMSRQTRKANAFVTGIGTTHRIVLGDTLIDAFPENEIEFVVAHELGHYVSKDTWRTIGLGEAWRSRFSSRRRQLPHATSGTNCAIADFLGRCTRRWRSRRKCCARCCSHFPVPGNGRRPFCAGNDPRCCVGAAAFRRLRDQNLADEDPPAWYEFFFSSHPSLKARIERSTLALERVSQPNQLVEERHQFGTFEAFQ